MKIYFFPCSYPCSFWERVTKTMKLYLKNADENFITSVVMTVDGKSYTADITDNTVYNNRSLYGIAEQRRSVNSSTQLLQQSYLILKR